MTIVCEPRYATRRRGKDEGRISYGPRVARIAEQLGTPLMDWQQLVVDVGLEFKTVNGLLVPAYREVIVTIPRQNGKTTLVLSWELDRCLMWGRPQRVAYTAQTGLDARKKVLEDQLPMLQRSILAAGIENVRRAQGSEGIDFLGGSQLDVLASTDSAGHGRTLDLGVIDEAFKDTDDRREGAMLPAMATRSDAQLLVVSTMGTDASYYLNRKIDAGRDVVLRDSETAEIAYFEWAADEHADIDDPRTWQSCMPAYGVTVNERAVRHARESMTEGEFRRAFLNQRTASEDRVIPVDVWARVCGDVKAARDGTIIFGIDCSPERTHATIAVADQAGRVEIVDHDEGTAWLATHVIEKAKRFGARVAYDPAGPAGVFGDEVAKNGIQTIPIGGRVLAHACSLFFDAVIDQKIQVRTDGALNAALAAAKQRVSGDAWVWGRRNETDISPLVATTIAYFAVQRGVDPVANVH
jgi:phage terminase large subunit-like protein